MINPSELEKVEFSTAFRGYNADQVDDYVDKVVQKYSEAYNNAIEYEKLCQSQLDKIQLLERKIAAYEKELNNAKINAADPDYISFNKYKEKAIELRDLIREFKANIFNLYQGQIKELQSFEFDTRIDEIIESPDLNEQVMNDSVLVPDVDKDLTEKESKQEIEYNEGNDETAQDISQLAEKVSDLVQPNQSEVSANENEEDNVENLITELSNLLNVGIQQSTEEEVQFEPDSTRVSMAKKIFDNDDMTGSDKNSTLTINPTGKATNVSFNNMFITE